MQSLLKQIFCTSALALAGGVTASAAITGQWDFNSGSLAATTGAPLEYFDGAGGPTQQATLFGATTALGISDIGGVPAQVMGFPRSLPTMGYLMRAGLPANGGGGFANQYTIIMDVFYPASSTTAFRALMQIDDPTNVNDADFFINPAGGVGISGSYQGNVTADAWHRVAIAVDLTAPAGAQARKYVDGVFVGQQTLGPLDGRWAIAPIGGAFPESTLLFTDNNADGADAPPGFVNSIQVHDEALSGAYLQALGGPKAEGIAATVMVPVTITSQTPGPNAVNINSASAVTVAVTKGSEAFDPASLSMRLNNQPLTVIATTDGDVTTLQGTLPALPAKSTNTLSLILTDPAQGGVVTQNWTFRVAAYNLDAGLVASFPQGLTAYYKFDEGTTNVLETTVYDTARENEGNLVTADPSTQWLVGSEAVFGGALRFGAETYVEMTNITGLNIDTNQASISVWVKLEMLPSELSESFGAIWDSVEDNYVLYMDRANRELRFKVTDVNGQAARPGIPESALKIGEWMLVTAVYDGKASAAAGEARIYLNGQLMDTHAGNDGSAPAAGLTGNVRPGQVPAIGKAGAAAGGVLPGSLDDLAIWAKALNIDEIGYLSSGHAVPISAAVTVPASIQSISPLNNAINVQIGGTAQVVFKEGSAPLNTNLIRITLNGSTVTPTITRAGGLVTAAFTIPNLPSRSQNSYAVTYNDPAQGGDITQTVNFRVAPYADTSLAGNLPSALVAYWNLDDATKNPDTTTLEDLVGLNDVTLHATAEITTNWLSGADAKFGGAFYFGPNVYGEVPNTEELMLDTNTMSISLWVKSIYLPSEMPEGIGGIYDAVEDGYVLYFDRGNRELRFKVTAANGNAARPGIPQAQLRTNEWMNVIAVYDGGARTNAGEARIYLNGQLMDTHAGNDGSNPPAGLQQAVRTQVAAFGRNGAQTTTSVLHGAVDDLAIWTRVLSDDEIGYIASGQAIPQGGLTISTITVQGGTVTVKWSGASDPVQLQRRASLTEGTWENVGVPSTTGEATDTVTGATMFYRVGASN